MKKVQQVDLQLCFLKLRSTFVVEQHLTHALLKKRVYFFQNYITNSHAHKLLCPETWYF